MGSYNITIRGTGPHHNPNKADADRMARRFVHELTAAGHTIESASITYGGAEALDDGRTDEALPGEACSCGPNEACSRCPEAVS